MFLLLIISLLRLVAEVHMEKKMKNQKAKSKSSEARKQLSSVRVIQRNLVYIVGLPLNLADEDVNFLPRMLSNSIVAVLCICFVFRPPSPLLPSHFFLILNVNLLIFYFIFVQLLQQREYFGQYGKVLKVSMSRTTAGVVQQFPNNTCSV